MVIENYNKVYVVKDKFIIWHLKKGRLTSFKILSNVGAFSTLGISNSESSNWNRIIICILAVSRDFDNKYVISEISISSQAKYYTCKSNHKMPTESEKIRILKNKTKCVSFSCPKDPSTQKLSS